MQMQIARPTRPEQYEFVPSEAALRHSTPTPAIEQRLTALERCHGTMETLMCNLDHTFKKVEKSVAAMFTCLGEKGHTHHRHDSRESFFHSFLYF